ncbi:MAG: ring-cleaving dioxygenase [Desulfobacteraceae bacterium]|nr:MAG: ring-cleaving dioxygenase [Desulfobacteraceae bacterium]
MKTENSFDSRPNALSGIHHITAVASSAAVNLSFYETVLGLRLVKQTVNFDDPYTYHLYYGDYTGSPGTILTFFPWEKLPGGTAGAGMVAAVAFTIPGESVDWWFRRISDSGISAEKRMRFGDPLVSFSDPHGLPLELIGVSEPPSTAAWKESPIPAGHGIAGFHSATALVNSPEASERLLSEVMGMTLQEREGNRYRFQMGDSNAPGHFYDLAVDPEARPGRLGGGTVHHIAFRTEDEKGQKRWQERLRENGFSVTGVKDRKYFKSIYFHDPGGILFEIATDPPGFAVDEPVENLGETLKLPDSYEPMRAEIEKRLPPLRLN